MVPDRFLIRLNFQFIAATIVCTLTCRYHGYAVVYVEIIIIIYLDQGWRSMIPRVDKLLMPSYILIDKRIRVAS